MNTQDLKQIDNLLRTRLSDFRKEVKEDIDSAVMEILEVVDKNKSDKKVVNSLEKRVDALEKQISSY